MSSIPDVHTRQQTGSQIGKRLIIRLIAITLICASAAGYVVLRDKLSERDTEVAPLGLTSKTDAQSSGNALRRVSDLEIPARPILHVETVDSLRAAGSEATTPGELVLNQPSDFVSIHDRYYALDSGNNRLLVLDAAGQPLAALDEAVDSQLSLHSPMAMAMHDERLYIADSGAARIVVLNPSTTKVEQIVALDRQSEDEELPRPIGIAVGADGTIFVSDANNQRVLKHQTDGTLVSFAGTGKRDAGSYGLNTPGGLALDGEGNLYVVDILNNRVVKYAPDGQFLLQFGRPGDTAGSFARPKGVAVDEHGTVYVSDSLQAAVQAFDAQGNYAGLIGRREPGNRDSESLFKAPSELKIIDGRLFVTDRLAGPFVFEFAHER